MPADLVISTLSSDPARQIEAIETTARLLFRAHIPAFSRQRRIRPRVAAGGANTGLHMLHKPVDPMPLRNNVEPPLKEEGLVDAGADHRIERTSPVRTAHDTSLPRANSIPCLPCAEGETHGGRALRAVPSAALPPHRDTFG